MLRSALPVTIASAAVTAALLSGCSSPAGPAPAPAAGETAANAEASAEDTQSFLLGTWTCALYRDGNEQFSIVFEVSKDQMRVDYPEGSNPPYFAATLSWVGNTLYGESMEGPSSTAGQKAEIDGFPSTVPEEGEEVPITFTTAQATYLYNAYRQGGAVYLEGQGEIAGDTMECVR